MGVYRTKTCVGPLSFGGALARTHGAYCYGCGRNLPGSENRVAYCPTCLTELEATGRKPVTTGPTLGGKTVLPA
jgi:predicted amidophosphoribosyltransferase